MSAVKIKVRPQQKVRFPARCVHCEQPATEKLSIQRRLGRATRFVEVPLCSACAAIVAAKSGAEVRWQTISWMAMVIVAVLAFSVTLLFTPLAIPFILRLTIAILVAFLLGSLLWTLFQRVKQRAASPDKQAILTAATIDNFSWRTTTFKFANEPFAERFRLLNESLLMEQEA